MTVRWWTFTGYGVGSGVDDDVGDGVGLLSWRGGQGGAKAAARFIPDSSKSSFTAFMPYVL